MNTSTSKLGTGTKTMGCPKSILILKDAAVDEVKVNGPKQSKKHVTFDRFTKYYSYTENWQVKLEKTCPLSNDDWDLNEEQLNAVSARGKREQRL